MRQVSHLVPNCVLQVGSKDKLVLSAIQNKKLPAP